MSYSEPIEMEPDDRLRAEQDLMEQDIEFIKFTKEREKEDRDERINN